MKEKKILLAAVLAAVLFCTCSCGREKVTWDMQVSSAEEEVSTTQHFEDKTKENTTENEEEPISPSVEDSTKNDNTITIYICGAVAAPGVYELQTNARIVQAIEAAGGLLEEADLISVNQAKKLEDGEQVRIYTKEEIEALPAGTDLGNEGIDSNKQTGESGKININTADRESLMTLPGIGAAKAEAIIGFREQNGSFKSIEDIMKISGIKEAVFSNIQDKISVD